MTQVTACAIAPIVTVTNGQPTALSTDVARHFDKRHDTVLRAISRLECSPEFTARNFAPSDYTDSTGRKLPCYRITRDGFVFLAMGFTGKEAARWKEAYIDAFNKMEAQLQAQTPSSQNPDLGRGSHAPTFRRRRFLVSIDDEGREAIQPLPDDATVASRAQWPRLIRDPDFCASPDELRDIMHASIDRMSYLLAHAIQAPELAHPLKT